MYVYEIVGKWNNTILVLPFIKMCQVMNDAEDEHTMDIKTYPV